jgi:hypothetical protein
MPRIDVNGGCALTSEVTVITHEPVTRSPGSFAASST